MGEMPGEDGIRWQQLPLGERMLLLSIAVHPKREYEWLTARKLCFYGLAQITPKGLWLTWRVRHVVAARHGLPVVVGRSAAHESSQIRTNLLC